MAAPAGDAPRHWLLKSEPDVFSFDDLLAAPERTTHWDGVRNYQARNFMREMRAGDLAFLYHSSTDPMAIVGVVRVARTAYPDHTAFDPHDPHFDPKSKRDEPTWFMVDVEAVEPLPHAVTLAELRENPRLAGMELLRKGNRLSIQPVRAAEWDEVLRMARGK